MACHYLLRKNIQKSQKIVLKNCSVKQLKNCVKNEKHFVLKNFSVKQLKKCVKNISVKKYKKN